MVEERDTNQSHLRMIYRPQVDPADPAQRAAFDVYATLLGGSMGSRLFDEIREQRGLAYAVYSSPSAYADAGALTVYAGTAPGTAPLVLDLVDEQLAKLRADGITDDELAVAKGYLTGSFLLGLEDTASRMARLGGLLTTTGAIRPVDDQLARWQAVTQADVCRVVARVLDGPHSLAALGPLTKKSLAGRAA
jgi:predicted Zn-dependent peptidase